MDQSRLPELVTDDILYVLFFRGNPATGTAKPINAKQSCTMHGALPRTCKETSVFEKELFARG